MTLSSHAARSHNLVFPNPSQFCPSSSSPCNSGWPASVRAGRYHTSRYPAASPGKFCLCHLLSAANRNTNINEYHQLAYSEPVLWAIGLAREQHKWATVHSCQKTPTYWRTQFHRMAERCFSNSRHYYLFKHWLHWTSALHTHTWLKILVLKYLTKNLSQQWLID